MKAWQKRVIPAAAGILILALVYLLFCGPPPEGSVLQRDIVSYCTGDATGDGIPELLAVSGEGEIGTGERHGVLLLVCDESAEADLTSRGYIPPEKIRYSFDLSDYKPMKVQLGDINGDGVNEVSVCVYKTAKFHPVMAKRPFFFDLVGGNLVPVWLGSRLSRPFDDYILFDVNDDGADEIISIEALEDGRRVVAAYNWKGFGFELLDESEAFDGAISFGIGTRAPTELYVTYSNAREQSKLVFRLKEDALIYSKQ
jgi:hypothetical protein